MRRRALILLLTPLLLYGKNFVAFQEGDVYAYAPKHPIAHDSLKVSVNKLFDSWSLEEHLASFHLQQKIVTVLGTNQFLMYGHQAPDKTFRWEIVPFSPTNGKIKRTWQQFRVAWRSILIGGTTLSSKKRQQLADSYRKALPNPQPSSEHPATYDPFCEPHIIHKQRIFEGKYMEVLYDYAPLQRLHFLILPKTHRQAFNELTEEEYLEAMELAQKLIVHFQKEAKEIHMLHKSGIDAGQTVPHWHLHLILTTNRSSSCFGKITLLKRLMIRSRPLKDNIFQKRITTFRSKLTHSI